MTEKPLHVRVAEALGWTAWHSKHDYWIITEPDGTRHEDGYGQPNPKYDSQTGKKVQPRQWWEEYDPPRYDTDWSATGPLIERFRPHAEVRLDPLCHEPKWCAFYIPDGDEDIIESSKQPTLLLAICHLILALKEAGKLETTEAAQR